MSRPNTAIVGINCALNEERIGLALGYFDGKDTFIEKIAAGGLDAPVSEIVAGWISDKNAALIALDAPLGWPLRLSDSLADHKAGLPVAVPANQLFRRQTDRYVHEQIGKTPLEIGADRIARTSHSALSMLDKLRVITGRPISLAWRPSFASGLYAIEVFPAATLKAHGILIPGYMKRDGRDARRALLNYLAWNMKLPQDTSILKENVDALDAAICILAGTDFLLSEAMEPEDMKIAKKEGWIWVRRPVSKNELQELQKKFMSNSS